MVQAMDQRAGAMKCKVLIYYNIYSTYITSIYIPIYIIIYTMKCKVAVAGELSQEVFLITDDDDNNNADDNDADDNDDNR